MCETCFLAARYKSQSWSSGGIASDTCTPFLHVTASICGSLNFFFHFMYTNVSTATALKIKGVSCESESLLSCKTYCLWAKHWQPKWTGGAAVCIAQFPVWSSASLKLRVLISCFSLKMLPSHVQKDALMPRSPHGKQWQWLQRHKWPDNCIWKVIWSGRLLAPLIYPTFTDGQDGGDGCAHAAEATEKWQERDLW